MSHVNKNSENSLVNASSPNELLMFDKLNTPIIRKRPGYVHALRQIYRDSLSSQLLHWQQQTKLLQPTEMTVINSY